jgi:hypothetical protein
MFKELDILTKTLMWWGYMIWKNMEWIILKKANFQKSF